MTTIKQVFDQFDVPANQRFHPKVESIDIGDYTFTDMNKPDPFVWDFTSKDNPNIYLRLNEDRNSVVLFKLNDDDSVTATSWIHNEKITRKLDEKYPFK